MINHYLILMIFSIAILIGCKTDERSSNVQSSRVNSIELLSRDRCQNFDELSDLAKAADGKAYRLEEGLAYTRCYFLSGIDYGEIAIWTKHDSGEYRVAYRNTLLLPELEFTGNDIKITYRQSSGDNVEVLVINREKLIAQQVNAPDASGAGDL